MAIPLSHSFKYCGRFAIADRRPAHDIRMSSQAGTSATICRNAPPAHHRRFLRRCDLAVRSLAPLVLLLSLAGCVFSPGQDFSNVRGDGNDSVHLVTITPDLVASDQSRNQVAAVPATLLAYHPQAYQIGPGDTLYITVWDHPELTAPAGNQQQTNANDRLVRPDGTLFYPFIGDLQVAGMTIGQVRQAIAEKLARYINNPQVDVSVVGYNSQRVQMDGAFTKTGPQPITAVPLTLDEAIGVAGVDAANANLSNVVLSRNGADYHLNLDQDKAQDGKIYLAPGDRVYLSYNDRQEVYVLGEVMKPSAIRFKTADLTLTQAIGEAGGLSQTTAQGVVYVIRRDKGQGQRYVTVYELDGHSPAAFALGDGFNVKPGDVVFASAAGITRWNRFLSQLLPSTSALSAAAAASYDFNHN